MVPGNLFGKAAAFVLLVILLLIGMVMFRGVSRPATSGRVERDSSSAHGDVVTFPPPYALEQKTLKDEIDGRKASERQLKPAFHDVSDRPVSGNQPESSAFHKLPEKYFRPQTVETVRNAAEAFKGLLEASTEAEATTRHATPAPAPPPAREVVGP